MKRIVWRLAGAAAAAGIFLAAAVTAASAGSYESHDRIYADSHGNLVVHNPSGYKRIVVGQGHLAEELAAYERGQAPKLAERAPLLRQRHCYSVATFWRGRSRMYGLADGEIPQPRVVCR